MGLRSKDQNTNLQCLVKRIFTNKDVCPNTLSLVSRRVEVVVVLFCFVFVNVCKLLLYNYLDPLKLVNLGHKW